MPNTNPFNSGINPIDFDQVKAEVNKLTPMFIENPPVLIVTCARYQLGSSVGLLLNTGHSREEIMDMVVEAFNHSFDWKEYHDSEHPTETGREDARSPHERTGGG